MLDELRFYTFRTILVASPCMMQSMAAVLVVHGGGANANQRWWSVGWKIAKEQRDATKDFCILFVEFGVLMLVCISFYTYNRVLLCTFVFLMLVSISFYTLLEQVYVVFMRQ
jgi:cytochrome c biogenesis protein CcdA